MESRKVFLCSLLDFIHGASSDTPIGFVNTIAAVTVNYGLVGNSLSRCESEITKVNSVEGAISLAYSRHTLIRWVVVKAHVLKLS